MTYGMSNNFWPGRRGGHVHFWMATGEVKYSREGNQGSQINFGRVAGQVKYMLGGQRCKSNTFSEGNKGCQKHFEGATWEVK